MTEKKEKKLIQTKNFFVIRAIVTGKDNPTKNNGFKSGVLENGKYKGKSYKSIRFIAKTSDDNIVPVELFGSEEDFVCFYNKDLKKTAKLEWNKKGMKAPEGYALITPKYDLVQEINDTYNDGDAVVITGTIEYSKYKDAQGNEKLQTKYIIKDIKASQKEVDFEVENFEELNEFNQEIVVTDVEEVKSEGKLYLNAYHINYNETFIPIKLEVNTSDAGFVKIIKSFKFGDFVKVNGIINNRAIETEEEAVSHWGQQSKSSVVKSYNKSLEVLGATPESYVKKKYKEDDFVVVEEINEPDWSEINNTTTQEVGKLPFDL